MLPFFAGKIVVSTEWTKEELQIQHSEGREVCRCYAAIFDILHYTTIAKRLFFLRIKILSLFSIDMKKMFLTHRYSVK